MEGVHVLSSKLLFGQEKEEGSTLIKIFCEFQHAGVTISKFIP
jgi:hypothetical protein